MYMAKKENKLVNEADEHYNVLTGDEEVKRLAEIRLLSVMEENSALETAKQVGTEIGMEHGLKEGKKKGLKEGKEQGLKEGKQQGLKEGKQQGLKEGKIEIAKKLLSKNIDIKEISNITGLPIDEIERLK